MLPNEDLYKTYKAQTECFGDGWDGAPSGDEVCQGCTANTQCFEHFSLVTLPSAIQTMESSGEAPHPAAIQKHFASQPDPMDFDLSMESVQQAIDNYTMHNPPAPKLVQQPAFEPVVEVAEDTDTLMLDDDDDYILPSLDDDDDMILLADSGDNEPLIEPGPELPTPEMPPKNAEPAPLKQQITPPSLGATPAMPSFEPQQTKVATEVLEPPKLEDTGGPSVNFTVAGSAKTVTEPASTQEQTKRAKNATQQVLREAVAQKRGRGRPVGSKKPLNQLKNKRYQRDRQRFENQWEAWGPQTYLSRWNQERERWPTLARLPIGTVIRRHHNENTYKVTLKQGYWEFSHPSVEQSQRQSRWPTLSSITRAITGFYQGPKWFKIEESLNLPVKEAILSRLRDKDL
jgi:hypothetical protein